jgi:uncharacterized oxidoreductase
MNLSQQTILITGGTSGIGLELAKELLHANNTVIICGRRLNRLEQIKAKYPRIIIKQCDVADTAEREELFNWATQNFPEVSVLINNAGIQLTADLTKPLDLTRMQDEITTNLIAPLHLSSLFACHLSSKPNAAIMNVTSGLAFAPLAFMPVYCATKAAMHSATLSLRFQLKNTSIKVFEIIPPAVDTELGHDRRNDKSQLHGGMPVNEFVAGVLQAIKEDNYEAAIGMAVGLKEKREVLFEQMNSRF